MVDVRAHGLDAFKHTIGYYWLSTIISAGDLEEDVPCGTMDREHKS
jgi:hypothetical protein